MKARIKATNEIVNVAEYAKIALEQCDSWGNPVEMKPEEIELIDDDADKQGTTDERRWQILLAVIPAVIDPERLINEKRIASDACDIADAVIEEWNKREAKRKSSGVSK